MVFYLRVERLTNLEGSVYCWKLTLVKRMIPKVPIREGIAAVFFKFMFGDSSTVWVAGKYLSGSFKDYSIFLLCWRILISCEPKYIGVTLDAKLTYKSQLECVSKLRDLSRTFLDRGMFDKSWGLVWWHKASLGYAASTLCKVHSIACFGTRKAMFSLSIAAMENILGLLSLHLALWSEATLVTYKVRASRCKGFSGKTGDHAGIFTYISASI